MADEFTEDRFEWRLTFYVFGSGLLAVLLIELCSYFDILEILYFLALVPLVSLILLVIAAVNSKRKKQRRSLSILLALIALCGTSWLLWKNSMEMRAKERWFLHAKTYKAEVLSQPITRNGELQHMEWDGWGFAGSDTVVYLVYDTNDSLVSTTRGHSAHNLKGISCDVWQVHRLESRWYSVVFYTDTAWDDC